MSKFVILECFDPLYCIEIGDSRTLDIDVSGGKSPKTLVTLSIWILAGIFGGTKLFSLASIGISGSTWYPITAMSATIRRMGTGFFAIFTEALVRNWAYDQDFFFFCAGSESHASVPTA